jgi:hypothetical protein
MYTKADLKDDVPFQNLPKGIHEKYRKLEEYYLL